MKDEKKSEGLDIPKKVFDVIMNFDKDGELTRKLIRQSFYEEGFEEGFKIGYEKDKRKISMAKNLLISGIPISIISSVTGLSEKEINDIKLNI